MRRTDKEINTRLEIDEIINKAEVCRLAFAKDNEPYLVPVSYGYDGENIFIHTAREGKKINFLKLNDRVCFEFEADTKIVTHASIPCKWTASFRSVIGFGRMIKITDEAEAMHALNQIMLKYSCKEWDFTNRDLARVYLWKIKIEEISGKKS
ncbi:MAG: pyridoxamine 5'-phosphate oxidase family protein [Chlorobi bacterium]|nr:pyridoxamine 5'-phosphate oxidase family protein [Chlorobiota bacterium]